MGVAYGNYFPFCMCDVLYHHNVIGCDDAKFYYANDAARLQGTLLAMENMNTCMALRSFVRSLFVPSGRWLDVGSLSTCLRPPPVL